MKNIRSKSIAALSIVLLLSSVQVRAMENQLVEPSSSVLGVEVAAPAVEVSAPAVEVVAPVAEVVAAPVVEVVAPAVEVIAPVQPVVESKGWMNSVRNGFSSAGSAVEKAKEFVGKQASNLKDVATTQATNLYEVAKAHPYITKGVAATAAVAATGFVVYKAGKAVKASRAYNALIAEIEAEIKNDMSTVQVTLLDNQFNSTAKVAGSCDLAANLPDLIAKLDPKGLYTPALINFCTAAKAWDDASDFSVDRLQELNDAHDALKKLGLNLDVTVKPSLMQKIAALVPTKATLKKAASALVPSKKTALITASVAVPAVVTAIAYKKGYLDNAIATSSDAVKNAANATRNFDYAGNFAKVQNNVIVPATGFVANHKKAFGYAIGTPVALGAGFGAYRFANNRFAKAKAAKAAQPAPVAILPAPELANAIKQA